MIAASIPLSVIVVNTNRVDMLRQCLTALRAADLPDGWELIVVDNASQDGSPEMVETEFPEARVIRQAHRGGPAVNYNAGFAAASGDYLVVLNEDAEVTVDTLSKLRAFMEANPRTGMCGPRLIYPDGTPQRCCNRFPGLPSVFKRLLFQSFVKSAWVDDAYAEELADRPFRPDWMMATSLVIRKKALDEVGPYDEQFVIYYEEVDLALRLKRAGWGVSFVPEALVRHHHGLSNFKLRNERDILFRLLLYQSRYRYFRKNGGPLLSLLIRGLEAGFFGLFTLKTRLEALLPSHRDAARLKVQLYGSLLRYALHCRPAYAIPQPGE